MRIILLRKKCRRLARAGGFGAVLLLAAQLRAELVLPGSQPKEHDFHFRDVANCQQCHSGTKNGAADPYFSWQGGMMAQAARDPVFRSALAIANQDIPGVGEFCIRCHSPRAWLEGRSTAADASLLKGDDLHGVSCDVCHRLVDPLSPEAKTLAKQVPPGYGNGMFVVDTERILRGPYGEPKGLTMHTTRQSEYHASGELCGNCHNVSNPTFATNVLTQPPSAFGHIERTYSEWSLSDFAKKESLQSCQSCHFPFVEGGGQAVNYQSRRGEAHRDHFVSHSTVGGSTWVQNAIYKIWKGKNVNKEALDVAQENARKLLKTAAALGLDCSQGKARLTITNLTGHKLPSGYPEGRRMWVNVRFFQGKRLLDELGRYQEKKDELNFPEITMTKEREREIMPSVPRRFVGKLDVNAPTLIDPERTRVYECKPGISAEQSKKHQKAVGPSFHFILNDVITKDNRIPPRGFGNSAFAQHLAGAVGANYAEGQHWDQIEFVLPEETDRVEVRLMYQSVSWEYLKFLVENNKTDSWSRLLYEAWDTTGKCPPEEIAFIEKAVQR